METSANPMHNAHAAPRCHACAKSTGKRCNAPARHGWHVCRMHGAGGGAPTGPANGAWVHGDRSKAAAKDFQSLKSLVKLTKDSLRTLL